MVEIAGNAAAPQIGFGYGARNGARQRKQACSGLGGLAPVARFRSGNTGSATSLRGLIQEQRGPLQRPPSG